MFKFPPGSELGVGRTTTLNKKEVIKEAKICAARSLGGGKKQMAEMTMDKIASRTGLQVAL